MPFISREEKQNPETYMGHQDHSGRPYYADDCDENMHSGSHQSSCITSTDSEGDEENTKTHGTSTVGRNARSARKNRNRNSESPPNKPVNKQRGRKYLIPVVIGAAVLGLGGAGVGIGVCCCKNQKDSNAIGNGGEEAKKESEISDSLKSGVNDDNQNGKNGKSPSSSPGDPKGKDPTPGSKGSKGSKDAGEKKTIIANLKKQIADVKAEKNEELASLSRFTEPEILAGLNQKLEDLQKELARLEGNDNGVDNVDTSKKQDKKDKKDGGSKGKDSKGSKDAGEIDIGALRQQVLDMDKRVWEFPDIQSEKIEALYEQDKIEKGEDEAQKARDDGWKQLEKDLAALKEEGRKLMAKLDDARAKKDSGLDPNSNGYDVATRDWLKQKIKQIEQDDLYAKYVEARKKNEANPGSITEEEIDRLWESGITAGEEKEYFQEALKELILEGTLNFIPSTADRLRRELSRCETEAKELLANYFSTQDSDLTQLYINRNNECEALVEELHLWHADLSDSVKEEHNAVGHNPVLYNTQLNELVAKYEAGRKQVGSLNGKMGAAVALRRNGKDPDSQSAQELALYDQIDELHAEMYEMKQQIKQLKVNGN